LRHASAHQRPEQAAKHVIHAAARVAITTALGCAGLATALDGDHAGPLPPSLQHFRELLALIRGQVLHGSHGSSLQDLGGDFIPHTLQVIHGLFAAETLRWVAGRVAGHEVVLIVREISKLLALGPALGPARVTVVRVTGVSSLATPEQSLELV
jgi:hypothetical protein